MSDDTSTSAVPNPGSNEALALGCTCPVLDNARGKGCGGRFWIAAGCPVHAWPRRGTAAETPDADA